MSVQESHIVGVADTASALGSGDVQVLGTPRLLAWLEAATVLVAQPWTDDQRTTVGIEVRVRHRRPSSVGETVTVTAEASGDVERGRLTFAVRARNSDGTAVADGEIVRAVVSRSDIA